MLDTLVLADAVRVVYEYGVEFREESFIELTGEQYESLERQGKEMTRPWFRVSRGIFEERNNPPVELPIVDAGEKDRLLAAVALIHEMTAGKGGRLGDFKARLSYLQDRLPPGITKSGSG